MSTRLRRWPPAVLRWALAPEPEGRGRAKNRPVRREAPFGSLGALGSAGTPPGAEDPSWAEIPGLHAMEVLDADLLLRGQPGYPAELEHLHDPPPFLWTRGAWWDALGPRVGIVGSRAASRAGRELAHAIARDLALAGVEVWSGLARGIDAAAHRGALAAQGRTAAVLGTGLDECYPAEHRDLLEGVVRSGGVVTEFPPQSPPRRFHFPRRNRILAALVDVLVVVEGGERSGARSTVDHALDLGREVMAVPRDPVHPGSALPNALLQDGAAPVVSSRDVLAALPRGVGGPPELAAVDRLRASDPSDRPAGPPGEVGAITPASRILELLETGSATVEELAHRGELGVGAVQAILLELELCGEIVRAEGRIRRRSHRGPSLRARR